MWLYIIFIVVALIILLLLLLMIGYIISNPLVFKYTKRIKATSYDIVISRYNECLNWLLEPCIYNNVKPGTRIIIYNSGQDMNIDNIVYEYTKINVDIEVIKVKNVGVNIYVNLHHIIEHYDDLADITLFLPGSADNKARKWKYTKKLFRNAWNRDTYFTNLLYVPNLSNFKIDNYVNDGNKGKVKSIPLKPCSIRPYGKWYKHMIGNDIPGNTTNYIDIFSASKEAIRKHDIDLYERLIGEVNRDVFTEAAHYIERTWFFLLK